MTFKKFLISSLFACLLVLAGCNSDNKCDKSCASDEIQLLDCTCQKKGSDKCTKTCSDGEVLTAECTCVKTGTEPVLSPVTHAGLINADEKWTADRIHFLGGKVVVAPGKTLTIEPGTIIKGKEGEESLASALVIQRGAKINAEGTAEKPIIFTSELDGIKVGETESTLDINVRELWGGLIVLGKAPVSVKNGDTEGLIEGIPSNETYGKYGGSDPADNSGVLKYVSIRHGGILIGDDNEINGLTLGGVGNGTVIENIEVISNLDDGVEFFGGTVNAKNILVALQGDDAVDIDQNYSGTIENVYIIHGRDTDEAFEIDGPENKTYADGKFVIKNATAVAADQEKTSGADLKSKAQGTMENVAWIGYKDGKGIKVEAIFDIDDNCKESNSAFTNAKAGNLVVKNSEFVSTNADAPIATVTIKKQKAKSEADKAEADRINAARKACLEASGNQATLNSALSAANNKVVSSATVGADKSAFDWTYAKKKNLVK